MGLGGRGMADVGGWRFRAYTQECRDVCLIAQGEMDAPGFPYARLLASCVLKGRH